MSLWSPVDLVNGGSGTRNIKTNNTNPLLANGNTQKSYEQILEQINAKLFPPQHNFLSSQEDNNLLYNQLSFQNSQQVKNKTTTASGSSGLDCNISDNNKLLIDNQRLSRNQNKSSNKQFKNNNNTKDNTDELFNQAMLYRNKLSNTNTSFNFDYGLNASTSKRGLSLEQNLLDNFFSSLNAKKMKVSHQQPQHHQQLNQNQIQLMQAQIQLQLAQFQQQQQALDLNKLQNQLQIQHLQKQQVQKQNQSIKNSQDQFIKNDSNKTLSFNKSMGFDMPLNLSTKKDTNNDLSSQLKNQFFNLSNNDSSQLDNEQLLDNLIRKRGRKPKSTLTSTQTSESLNLNQSNLSNNLLNINNSTSNLNKNSPDSSFLAYSSVLDNKPRKRGRPPSTSSPKVDMSQVQPQLNLANAAALLQTAGFPSELFNTPRGKSLLPLLAAATSSANSNRNNDLTQELLNAQLMQQLTNQIKVMQSSILASSSNGSSSNVIPSSSGSNSIVIEEIKRDATDSGADDSDYDSQSSKTDFEKSASVKNYDERSLRLPKLYDWRRQTIIKVISKSGVKGEVIYITPCGKKLKNLSEIEKYLLKSNVNNLRKEQFNFNSKIIIGEYLMPLPDNSNEYKTLTENDVLNHIEKIRLSLKKTLVLKTSKKQSLACSSSGAMHDSKDLNKKIDVSQQLEHQKKKHKEYEEAKLKEEELKNKIKEEEAKKLELQKEQELKKKKEYAVLAEIERERKKQNSILVKTLEMNRKNMERDKRIITFTNERRLQQDKRNLKKRIELELIKEIKKPVEDLMLKDLKNLQALNRIPGLKLSGKAFANLLMVFEFLHSFYETINFDKEKIPSLNRFQAALLNLNESAEDDLLVILQHLLATAIEDPGLPINANTITGQKLKDVSITNLNITEILKIYFQSYITQIRDDSCLERIEFKLFNILDSGKPYLSLNASIKVEILAYICNELLCNQAIIKKIEDRIETAENLKRDKWLIENELRKYKLLKVKRERLLEEENTTENSESKNKLEKFIPDQGDVSESDCDSTTVYGNEIEEEDKLTDADLDKNIEKLTRNTNNMANKLNKVINEYRITSFGQDRYRRRYWCLPNAGGVFIESMESCELDENLKLLEEEEKNDIIIENKNEPLNCDENDKVELKENLNDENSEKNENNTKMDIDEKTEKVSIKKETVDSTDEQDKTEEKNQEKIKLDLLSSQYISPLIKNVYANYASKLCNSLSKEIIYLPGLEFLNKAIYVSKHVFSILPRTSCNKEIETQNDEKNKNNLSFYRINETYILPQDLDICTSLQSQLIEYRKLELDKIKKIPDEYRNGWWRITDTNQLKQLADSMHDRAIREKNLKRHILKYFNNLLVKIRHNNVEFDITNLDRIISQKCPYGAPLPQSNDEWSEETALKLDLLVLDLVENLEETIASSSMQIRGWKPIPKINLNDKDFTIYPLYGTKCVSQTLDKDLFDSENSKDSSYSSDKFNNPIFIARERLLAAEAGIERRYLKHPLGFKSNTILLPSGSDEYADNAADENATSGLIRWRDAVRECESGSQLALLLGFLESCIAWDKSIMRASCQFCNSGENEAELLLCDGCDKGYHTYCFKPKMETIPEGDWFCFECSNKNSIDKVCVVCGKKGKLINCDTCPKVFHPNCLDPPISKPQKCRWYCFMCLRKSKKNVKQTPNSRQIKITLSNLSCEDKSGCSDKVSNISNISKGNSTSKDNKKKPSKKDTSINESISEKDSKKKVKETKESNHQKDKKHKDEKSKKDEKSSKSKKNDSLSEKHLKEKEIVVKETFNEKSKESRSKKKSSNKDTSHSNLSSTTSSESKKSDKDYNPSPYEILLDDIKQHKDAWPFLTPVDTNQFPQYKKIIKKPMDFQTIKNKLDSGVYTDPSNFLADCRLIFDNCVTFNEDESPVGKAGHNLREFIEARWNELVE